MDLTSWTFDGTVMRGKMSSKLILVLLRGDGPLHLCTCACKLFILGEYHNILSKVVPDAKDEILQESKSFLRSEVVLYEFDGKGCSFVTVYGLVTSAWYFFTSKVLTIKRRIYFNMINCI